MGLAFFVSMGFVGILDQLRKWVTGAAAYMLFRYVLRIVCRTCRRDGLRGFEFPFLAWLVV